MLCGQTCSTEYPACLRAGPAQDIMHNLVEEVAVIVAMGKHFCGGDDDEEEEALPERPAEEEAGGVEKPEGATRGGDIHK